MGDEGGDRDGSPATQRERLEYAHESDDRRFHPEQLTLFGLIFAVAACVGYTTIGPKAWYLCGHEFDGGAAALTAVGVAVVAVATACLYVPCISRMRPNGALLMGAFLGLSSPIMGVLIAYVIYR